MVVGVDAFSKWIELASIPSHHSYETAKWFHQQITYCFGKLLVVKVDQGSEFKGHFQEYMDKYGIKVRKINTAVPRGQGHAERMIGVIKSALHKLLLED